MARERYFLICTIVQSGRPSRMLGRRRGIQQKSISSFRGKLQLNQQYDEVDEKWSVLGETQIEVQVTRFLG